ncbi:kelch-like protein 10 [Anthonomus grandis grandis]|uniref:kelch-like protein 10 n=1 Tax=Anthonomus grandis grandis TaxID=2921223 RepID=UPI0021660B45|nr:kelch-like protein 10 [Anthonomus grandis grandis]
MVFHMKLRTMSSKRKPLYFRNVKQIKRRKQSIGRRCCCRCSSSLQLPLLWKEMRENNQLCDGVVRCEDGVVFNIHRIVLTAVSPYFRALFTNSINRGCMEITEANVRISSGAFRVIIDYAYTRNCVINKSNVFELLKYADQYEILDVVEKCCEFLVKDLTASNCLQVLKFASQFFCKSLTDRSNIYLLQNFANVFKDNEHFCDLSGEHLRQILADDCLNVKSEEVVFEAIKRWTEHCSEGRQKYLLDLIKCVRLGNLPQEKIVKIAHWQAIQADTACTLYLTDILTIMEDFGESLMKQKSTYLMRPRIPYDILFAVGGWSAGSPTSFVETYDNRADRWLVSKDTDVVARAYHGMCSYDGKIFIVGGFDGNEYFNTARCFDPAVHLWKDCACMHYSRCYVSVVLCLDRIYALGGYNGRIRMNSAERYDPVSNQWELIPSMQKQRSDASAATLNDKIYIVGGFNGQEVMNSAEMFDPSTNQWSYIPQMASPRSGVSLIAYHDALYAIGGFNGYTRLPTMEVFIPGASAEWMEGSEMTTSRSNFGTVILDDYIYVIGGFNGSTTINYVEYYDVETDEWVDAAPMNLNRSALSACVISGLRNSKDYSFLDRSRKELHEDVKEDCD